MLKVWNDCACTNYHFLQLQTTYETPWYDTKLKWYDTKEKSRGPTYGMKEVFTKSSCWKYTLKIQA